MNGYHNALYFDRFARQSYRRFRRIEPVNREKIILLSNVPTVFNCRPFGFYEIKYTWPSINFYSIFKLKSIISGKTIKKKTNYECGDLSKLKKSNRCAGQSSSFSPCFAVTDRSGSFNRRDSSPGRISSLALPMKIYASKANGRIM